MTRNRLPGTDPLDRLSRAPAGQYLSVLWSGHPDTQAELALARILGEVYKGTARDDILFKDEEIEGHVRKAGLPYAPITRDGCTFWIMGDFSAFITLEKGHHHSLIPFAFDLDQPRIRCEIGRELGVDKRRLPDLSIQSGGRFMVTPQGWNGNAICINKTLADIGQNVLVSLTQDALIFSSWVRGLGPILTSATSDDQGYFSPLMGSLRLRLADGAKLLKSAAESEIVWLMQHLPELREQNPKIIIKGSLPDRQGKLSAPRAQLLLSEKPADPAIAGLIVPAVEIYAASEDILPDRRLACCYRAGHSLRDKTNLSRPIEALIPYDFIGISHPKDASSHEIIGHIQRRSELRAQHTEQFAELAPDTPT